VTAIRSRRLGGQGSLGAPFSSWARWCSSDSAFGGRSPMARRPPRPWPWLGLGSRHPMDEDRCWTGALRGGRLMSAAMGKSSESCAQTRICPSVRVAGAWQTGPATHLSVGISRGSRIVFALHDVSPQGDRLAAAARAAVINERPGTTLRSCQRRQLGFCRSPHHKTAIHTSKARASARAALAANRPSPTCPTQTRAPRRWWTSP